MTWQRLDYSVINICLSESQFNKDTWDSICKALLNMKGEDISEISVSNRFGGIEYLKKEHKV